MIIESGRVSMGTGAPLPPEVFVVVDSVGTLITVGSRARRVAPLYCVGERLDEVHLVPETHKPPVEQGRVTMYIKISSQSLLNRMRAQLIPLPYIKLVRYSRYNVAFWSYSVSDTVSLQP